MNSVLETLSLSKRGLVLLAPVGVAVPDRFSNRAIDPKLHGRLLDNMQRLRGRIYMDDGAIAANELTDDGRHTVPGDAHSWHVLALENGEEVVGCARCRFFDGKVVFEALSAGRSAMARTEDWGPKLRAAFEREAHELMRRKLGLVELGGWALREDVRGTVESLRIALAAFSLSQLLGAGIGLTTATVRNRSASILRKIGGEPLAFEGEEIPRYFEPRYDCEMEILKFDSRRPNLKYRGCLDQIRAYLAGVTVVSGTYQEAFSRSFAFSGLTRMLHPHSA